jgi:uncharacterized membrane protein YdjX (TVP38/TMEM64 family)
MSARESSAEQETSLASILKRMALFLLLALGGLAISHFTPHGGKLTVDGLSDWAGRLGAWGPAILIAAGILTPLAFMPRWPIAFVAGLLYGLVGGTLLSTAASTLGAWLHFHLSRSLLAPVTRRVLRKTNLERYRLPKEHEFTAILLLRAFPLSNFVLTNILSGALGLNVRRYVLASFLGMIPSSLMYAAWGKLLKKPSGEFYVVAVLTLVFVAGGAVWGGRLLAKWRQGGEGGERTAP